MTAPLRFNLLCAGFLLGSMTLSLAQERVETRSPNGKLAITVTMEQGTPNYSIAYQDRPVILESALGINGNGDWTQQMQIAEVTRSSCDTTWKPLYGERSEIPDRYNQSFIRFTQQGHPSELQLEIRAYDEGIAFRYLFPEGGGYLHITDEATEFTLPEGTMAYFTSFAQSEHQKLPLRNWPGESDRPLTIELPNGLYGALCEAQVVDYVRTKFKLSDQKANTVACAMYGAVDEIAPFATPWRVVMVAEKPGELIEHNYLLLNLNDPCAIDNTWWIKPGKAIREVKLSTQGGKDLVDFAVKRNLQYIEFDAGWYGYEYEKASDATKVNVDPRRNPINDLDLEEVIRYANERGIGVWVYVNHRALAAQLDTLLPLYHKWGIKGVKFGFVQVGSQMWTKWIHDAVKKCAEYQLMVDIHDEYRPTGFSRTYPNLLTQEGVRGNEEMPDATNNLILPFTRFVAGPADYTICYYRRDFDKYNPAKMDTIAPTSRFIHATSGQQLAMAVVYYSPVQFMYWYDTPEESQDEPELEFFDRVPTVWDDTKVLQGEIGEYITVARRKGNEWYVGCMNGIKPRTLDIPFDFLPTDQKYVAHIYRDGTMKTPTRTKVEIETRTVDAKTVLPAKLYGSGGLAIWLEPAETTQQ